MPKVRKEIDKEKMEKLMVGHRKKFVRYDEGAAIYSMGKTTFRELARDAGAVYHVKGIVLVNTEIVDQYLENFRDDFLYQKRFLKEQEYIFKNIRIYILEVIR